MGIFENFGNVSKHGIHMLTSTQCCNVCNILKIHLWFYQCSIRAHGRCFQAFPQSHHYHQNFFCRIGNQTQVVVVPWGNDRSTGPD